MLAVAMAAVRGKDRGRRRQAGGRHGRRRSRGPSLRHVESLQCRACGEACVSTTLARTPMNPATPVPLTVQLSQYVGPWLLLALVAALEIDGSGPVSTVPLLGSVDAPLTDPDGRGDLPGKARGVRHDLRGTPSSVLS